MTGEIIEATEVVDRPEQPEAPDGHYYTWLLDRWILIRQLNDAQAIMVGTIYRGLKTGAVTTIDGGMNALGRLGTLFDSLIVEEADRMALEEAMLTGRIALADFAQVFVTVRAPQKTEAPKQPKRGR